MITQRNLRGKSSICLSPPEYIYIYPTVIDSLQDQPVNIKTNIHVSQWKKPPGAVSRRTRSFFGLGDLQLPPARGSPFGAAAAQAPQALRAAQQGRHVAGEAPAAFGAAEVLELTSGCEKCDG